MNRIAQCVPNISEGRDIDKIEEIIQPLKDQPGFKLISVEPDKDYHRTVITLLGDPHFMILPLISFYERAQKLIDMNVHQGEHPRMGAVDVCPFIPIQNLSMDDCIEYAKSLADHVSHMLGIPCYLYAHAAQDPMRIDLPNIRKGEFEGMKDKIKDPQWRPDYGPAQIHPTFGVTAIGARMPLIAYNIDLDSDDLKKASQIAKAIRQSSGGFQYIQAGPAMLEKRGHVQVTMNILDYKKNPMYRIFETVKMEAKRFHVSVTGSEIIGLVPRDALLETIKYYYQAFDKPYDKTMSNEALIDACENHLGLRDFHMHKIIEANIHEGD